MNKQDVSSYGDVTVRRVVTGPVQENAVLLHDASGEGFLIDPGDDAPVLIRLVQEIGMRPSAVLLTHAHFDHVGAVQGVREAFGIPVYLHAGALEQYRFAAASAARWGLTVAQPSDPDGEIAQGQEFTAGRVRLRARELFGHAPGHVVFVDGRAEPEFVIAGDTLFQGSVGRTDLPGGNHAELIAGIQQELLTLPDAVRVHAGHGPDTTVGRERQFNPYLR